MSSCPPTQIVNGVPGTPPVAPTVRSPYVDTSALDVTGTTAQTVVSSYTFPAASLPYTAALVRMSARFSFSNRVNGTVRNQRWRYSFGGVVLWDANWNTTGATAYVPRPLRFDFELLIQQQSLQFLSGYVTMWQGSPAAAVGLGNASADNESNVSSLGTLDPVITPGAGSTADLANAQAMEFTYQANGSEAGLHLVRLGTWIEVLGS